MLLTSFLVANSNSTKHYSLSLSHSLNDILWLQIVAKLFNGGYIYHSISNSRLEPILFYIYPHFKCLYTILQYPRCHHLCGSYWIFHVNKNLPKHYSQCITFYFKENISLKIFPLQVHNAARDVPAGGPGLHSVPHDSQVRPE